MWTEPAKPALRGDHRARADARVVADVHVRVELGAAPDHRGPERAGVDRGERADLDVVLDRHAAELRDARTSAVRARSAQPNPGRPMTAPAPTIDARADAHAAVDDGVRLDRMRAESGSPMRTAPAATRRPDRCARPAQCARRRGRRGVRAAVRRGASGGASVVEQRGERPRRVRVDPAAPGGDERRRATRRPGAPRADAGRPRRSGARCSGARHRPAPARRSGATAATETIARGRRRRRRRDARASSASAGRRRAASRRSPRGPPRCSAPDLRLGAAASAGAAVPARRCPPGAGRAAAVVHLDDLIGEIEIAAHVRDGLLVEDGVVAVLRGEAARGGPSSCRRWAASARPASSAALCCSRRTPSGARPSAAASPPCASASACAERTLDCFSMSSRCFCSSFCLASSSCWRLSKSFFSVACARRPSSVSMTARCTSTTANFICCASADGGEEAAKAGRARRGSGSWRAAIHCAAGVASAATVLVKSRPVFSGDGLAEVTPPISTWMVTYST